VDILQKGNRKRLCYTEQPHHSLISIVLVDARLCYGSEQANGIIIVVVVILDAFRN